MDSIKKWRFVILFSMFIGYSSYNVTRKTFPYLITLFLDTTQKRGNGVDFTLTKREFGFISSSHSLAYAVSKIFAGYYSDKIGAKILFSTGLAASGLINIAIVYLVRSSVSLYLLWTLNGVVQACGLPPCVQLINAWFEKSSAGTVWSVLCVATTLISAVLPMIFVHITATYGWQGCYIAAGFWGICVSALLMPCTHNQPSDINLKNVIQEKDSADAPQKRNLGIIKTLQLVVRRPLLPYISICFLLSVYAKNGLEDWVQLFVAERFDGTLEDASITMSMFQLGGTFGSVAAGFASDKLVQYQQATPDKDRWSNPRLPVLVLFTVLTLLAYVGCHLAANTKRLNMWCALAGFAIYGPQALYGLLAIEDAPAGFHGTAFAAAAMSAYVGVFLAGYPLSLLLSRFGWDCHFVSLEVALVLNCIALVRACFVVREVKT